MRKCAALLALALVLGAFAVAQDAATTAPAAPPATAAAASAATPAAPDLNKAESAHYLVFSEVSAQRAADLDARLEKLFALYGAVFHFDPARLPGKLRVRDFAAKAGFDAYLFQVTGQNRDDFVYLPYSVPERSELLLYARDDAEAESSLAHHAFAQYLRAFVRNPPLWLQYGFSVFFETAVWDPASKGLAFKENLAWLETAKTMAAKDDFLPLERFFSLGFEEAKADIDTFYPESWAFVSFLANSTEDGYARLLWDSISALKPEASLEDNQAAVAALVADWFGADETKTAFYDYLKTRKTFADLIGDGVKAYDDKSYAAAKADFEAAAALDPASFVPPYYLGLLAFGAGDYSLAEFSYKAALKLGCDPATVNYALGVNAFVQNRAADSKAFLAEAVKAAPDRYTDRANELLKRLGM